MHIGPYRAYMFQVDSSEKNTTPHAARHAVHAANGHGHENTATRSADRSRFAWVTRAACMMAHWSDPTGWLGEGEEDEVLSIWKHV